MKTSFIGTGVALVTPFLADGQIDEAGFCNLLAFTQDHVNYWVVQGTTGESPTVSKNEKKRLLELAKQNNPKNLPIVYGLGGNNTQEVINNIKETNLEGVSGILSVTPYYNKPSQDGLYRHYLAIADASPVPIILYNVPSRTAVNMTAETTLKLAQHPNIVAIKDATTDLEQFIRIARDIPKDFLLLSGDDMQTVPMIAIGAKGVISVLANLVPQTFCQMINKALEGDYNGASQLLYKLLELNILMYKEGNPVGVKQGLALKGVCGSDVRLPVIKASESLKQAIEIALKGL